MKFKKLITTCLALVLLSACSTSSPFKSLTAGPCSGEQKQLVSAHISSQISAISKQDWPLAYSFAAKSFQDSVNSSYEKVELLYRLSLVDQKLGVQAADITEQSSVLTT
jgi:uncharacterized protein YcfL